MVRFGALIVGVSAAAITAGAALAQEAPKKPDTNVFGFRFLAPANGNRVAAIAGIPGDPSTYYAGAASGGIFKSDDGGNVWKPIFDDQPVAAIGALAVAPSDPKVVWAGTGEAWAVRDSDVGGDGVYKSTDAGKTWTHMGLPNAGRIGRIVVDPSNIEHVLVCTLGRMTAPQQDRGVYATSDGGKTWARSLFVDANTGCSGLVMDPNDPKTVFAGMWQVEMHPWGEYSGGAGSGLYVSHDGGSTWTHLTGNGLPHSPVGKIDVAVAPTDSKRVYALIQTDKQGSVWRSDDGGENWKAVSWDRTLIGRAGYYIRIAVSPGDENKVLIANSSFHVSTDGGMTWPEVRWGGDNHDIWMDPKDRKHFAISFDGGLAITTTEGKGMQRVSLPIGQMYHVAVDDQVPYYVYSNMQDNSTMRMPSTAGGGSGEDGWNRRMGGCESGFTLPDPTDPNVVWASCYADEVTRWDARSKHARSVSPWFHTLDSAPDQIKYRCHWTPPLAIDPFDHDTVYYGCQVVFKTVDAGQSWTVASPDLSTRDPSKVVPSGGIIGDNLGQFYGEVVFAIAPSKIQKGLVWAGTNDGKVWYTLHGGGDWTDVTANIPGMPKWGMVTSIEPSHFDPATAYVTVDAHLMDDTAPYVFMTTDMGKTFKRIDASLPRGPLAYVKNVSEDPNVSGLLFAGTGNAAYYSLSNGEDWTRLKEGLPPAPVTWTVVQKNFHDLVVSTYGRGLYILDDVSPLEDRARARQAGAAAQPVDFYTPRKTWRLPRANAFINFDLAAAPSKPVHIEITDAAGKPVRSMDRPGKAGFNRILWDMRHDSLRTITLRTIPPEDPHIWEEARFKGKDERPITHWGMAPRQAGPLIGPGVYQVKITVDGKSFTQPLEVALDPNGGGTPEGVAQTVALQQRIAADVDKVSDMVNPLERMRHQLQDLETKLSGDHRQAALLKSVEAMDERIQKVEYELFSKDLAPSDDKYYVSDYKIYYKLLWLNGEVGTGAGDVAGAGDNPPTATAPMLLDIIEKNLGEATEHWQALTRRDVPAFNKVLASHHLAPLALSPEGVSEEAAYEEDDPAADNADADD